MYNALKILLFASILGLGTLIVWKYFYFLKLQKRFGIETSKTMFLNNLHIKFLIPKRGSDTYKKTEKLLLNAGATFRVQTFYLCKYLIVFVTLVSAYLVFNTNLNLNVNSIKYDINYNRSMADYQIQTTNELVNIEIALVEEVKQFLISEGISPYDPLAVDIIESYINQKKVSYDSPSALAKRIIAKIIKEESLVLDYRMYLIIFCLAYLSYNAPNLLMAIKILLIDSKKDWEVLHCLTTYSIVANLPPYRVDTTLESLKDVSSIYKPTFERFKIALKQDDKEELNNIIDTVDNDDMQEILEILVLASEIGVNETVSNIDDLLEMKIKTLEVTAKKKRQVKTLLCFLPIVIILLMLFSYLMYGMAGVSQNMFMGI